MALALQDAPSPHMHAGSRLEVLRVFPKTRADQLRRGPVGHLGYFRNAFPARLVDEHAYADFLAFCQLSPGPASGQVGFSIGRAGRRRLDVGLS